MSDLIRFNLLDWRQARRQARKQRFFVALGVAAGLAIAVFGLLPYWHFGQLIAAQEAENGYLQNQINIADEKLDKIKSLKKVRRRIINRMQVIEDLQNSRPAVVHYFDQLAATIPEGVHLVSLGQSGDTTTLKGVANANPGVSEYMLNLARSPWFEQPRLIVIHHHYNGGRQYASFTLRVESTQPSNDAATKNGQDGQ